MKKKKLSTILSVVAAAFIFFGFGMIHGGSSTVETIGNILIGVGCLYLIYRLYISYNK